MDAVEQAALHAVQFHEATQAGNESGVARGTEQCQVAKTFPGLLIEVEIAGRLRPRTFHFRRNEEAGELAVEAIESFKWIAFLVSGQQVDQRQAGGIRM